MHGGGAKPSVLWANVVVGWWLIGWRFRAGKYELFGVLTHKGRSADSGHYTAWVKQVR